MKVVVLRQDAVLVTYTGRTAGPIVRCGLRERFLCASAVHLVTHDAIRIEKWLGSGLIGLIWSDGNALEPAATEGCDYELSFRNGATARTEYVRFLKAESLKVLTFKQAAFKPSWRMHADSDWLRNLGEGWVARWFEGFGQHNHIGRSNNAIIQLGIRPDEFSIRFNRRTSTERFPVDAEVEVDADLEETSFLSEDLAPVLYRLCDRRPAVGVTLSGNRHALVCRYETSTGDFTIAVPTYDLLQHARDATLFVPDRV